ncbi:MAG: ATP--guanido phosphotransferase [Clostridia bacterium]|nr:ATP--guanido phosphotransferase [Clostridia bacterium]
MAWYQVKGNDADTVFSSRIRFARNLTGYCFDKGLSEEGAREIIAKVGDALGADYVRTDLADLSPVKLESLVEQHLISRDLAAKKGPKALFRNDGKSLSVMTPEEDHIRLQCILPGLALRDAYRFACECDDALDAALELAFDDSLGYLTHCPTNLGTGMRASVMLFLPALTGARMIPSLSHQLSKIGLTMRGLYGEGSEPSGCLYQISNQVTLGISEEDILHKLEEAVQSIIESERRLRSGVEGEAAERRRDRIHRAEGVLRYATMLSSEEFFSLYTDLKLGIALGEITSISDEALNTLLINILPATLTEHAGVAPKSGAERDRQRAAFIKQALEVSQQ